jgi:hypothetical protein
MTTQLAGLIDPSIVDGIAFAIGVAAIGLWLAAAWWTYADMSRRTTSELGRFGAASWILLSTPALLILSLPVYVLARPQATISQRRSRQLVAELGPELLGGDRCGGCGIEVDDEWRRCPACSSWLQAPCADCGRWSPTSLDLCPWCAAARRAEPFTPRPLELSVAAGEPSKVQTVPLAVPAARIGDGLIVGPRGTPGLGDLRRSGGRSRGFERAVDDEPATVGR